MANKFTFNKVECNNLHDAVPIIKGLKSRDEATSFMKAFRAFLGQIADSQLSKFLQRHYAEESQALHESLQLPLWEIPDPNKTVTKPSKKGKNNG